MLKYSAIPEVAILQFPVVITLFEPQKETFWSHKYRKCGICVFVCECVSVLFVKLQLSGLVYFCVDFQIIFIHIDWTVNVAKYNGQPVLVWSISLIHVSSHITLRFRCLTNPQFRWFKCGLHAKNQAICLYSTLFVFFSFSPTVSLPSWCKTIFTWSIEHCIGNENTKRKYVQATTATCLKQASVWHFRVKCSPKSKPLLPS